MAVLDRRFDKSMKKFRCTVEKTYTYEIEFDETIWTEDNIKNWSEIFYDADDLEDVAKILAGMKTNFEVGEFIEGFNIPMINGKEPYVSKDNIQYLSKDININIIDEDDVHVECEEIN
jgi:hypothetical protein